MEVAMGTAIVADVMTRDVTAVDVSTSYQRIVNLLAERRISAVPVVDDFQRVLGVVSQADLLHRIEETQPVRARLPWEGRQRRAARVKGNATVAADLMTEPAVTTFASVSVTHAARQMDDLKVKRMPVVDDLGRLIGIVSRGDLLRAVAEPGARAGTSR
jgi:CBS domain-containing protein